MRDLSRYFDYEAFGRDYVRLLHGRLSFQSFAPAKKQSRVPRHLPLNPLHIKGLFRKERILFPWNTASPIFLFYK